MTHVYANKKIKEKNNVLLILDDVLCNHNFHQSPSLKKLFVRDRHINIAIIITFQYINSILHVAENNINFIFLDKRISIALSN